MTGLKTAGLIIILAILASHHILVPGLLIIATWYAARRLNIQIHLFRCPRCHRRYNNPLTHTHARRPARSH
jgi:hypothetical protein